MGRPGGAKSAPAPAPRTPGTAIAETAWPLAPPGVGCIRQLPPPPRAEPPALPVRPPRGARRGADGACHPSSLQEEAVTASSGTDSSLGTGARVGEPRHWGRSQCPHEAWVLLRCAHNLRFSGNQDGSVRTQNTGGGEDSKQSREFICKVGKEKAWRLTFTPHSSQAEKANCTNETAWGTEPGPERHAASANRPSLGLFLSKTDFPEKALDR